MIASSPLLYDFFLSSYTTSFVNFLMAHLYRSGTRDSPTELSASQMTSGHGTLSLLHTDTTQRAMCIFILEYIWLPRKITLKVSDRRILLSRLLYDSFLTLSTLRFSKATFIWSRKPEPPLPQINSRLSNWIHFIVKKFSRLQFIWQSQFCLVGEGIGELGGGGMWRRQDEKTPGVTCDQAVFLPFFLLHSPQTTPDPRFLEVGLLLVSAKDATIFSH